jgi:DNA-binding CsgD family transcriptional regulator
MAQPTQEQTLRRVLDVIDAGARAPAIPGRLAPQVLEALAAVVPCDSVTFADLDPDTSTHYAEDQTAGGDVSYLDEPLYEPDHIFWRLYPGSLFCSYPTRTGDDRSVTMRSDFHSTREWLQTPMGAALRDMGAVFEMMCPMPNVVRRSKRLLFARSGSRDFGEQDRFVMALLRPHLMEMLRASHHGEKAAELTERQQELMWLVAEGRTNVEIAATLHLSPHTVRTHLMNIFDRLGVTTRAAAVARVFAP